MKYEISINEKKQEIIDLFIEDELKGVKENLSDRTLGTLRIKFIGEWIDLKTDGETAIKKCLMDWVKEKGGNEVTVINEWHGDRITCWCSEYNGKTVDISNWWENKAA